MRTPAVLVAACAVCVMPAPAHGVCTDVLVDGEPWRVTRPHNTPYVTCEWFTRQPEFCEDFGQQPRVGANGMSGSEACCVCGGGVKGATGAPVPIATPPTPPPATTSAPSPAPTTPAPSPPTPTPVSTPAPITPAPAETACKDVLVNGAPWYVTSPHVTPHATCEFYAERDLCPQFGQHPWVGANGMPAAEACCVCGGGVKGATGAPVPIATPPTPPPATTSAPSPAPTTPAPSPPTLMPTPVSTPAPTTAAPAKGACKDVLVNGVPWYVTSPHVTPYATCEFYAERDLCPQFGQHPWVGANGMPAAEACCVCGGGERDEPPVKLEMLKDDGRTVRATAGSITGGSTPNQHLKVTVLGDNCTLTWRVMKMRAGLSWVVLREAPTGMLVFPHTGPWLPATTQVNASGFTIIYRTTGPETSPEFHLDFKCAGATSTPPTNVCHDVRVNEAAWRLESVDDATCEWFANKDTHCRDFGDGRYQGTNGMPANEACCVCGGGTHDDVLPTPTPSPDYDDDYDYYYYDYDYYYYYYYGYYDYFDHYYRGIYMEKYGDHYDYDN